jgi:DNA-binding transcriptional regulator YiaG
VKVVWDRAKDVANQRKHGVSFKEASELLVSGVEHLEIFDETHSDDEDRFISIGPIRRGPGPRRLDRAARRSGQDYQRPMGGSTRAGAISRPREENDMTDIPELTTRQLASAISARVRRRLMAGRFESGDDIAALRRFAKLTQTQFARAMGISVHTLRNWEQGRRTPEGPAIALLRIAARHPRILRENLRSAA